MNKMMKLLAVTIPLAFGLSSGAANAATNFTGDYAIGNWAQSLDGGVINTSAAPLFVWLTSSDSGGGSSNQDFTITAVAESDISFNWNYLSTDINGSAFDPFGFLLNGAFNKLTVDHAFDNNYDPQSGFFTQHVNKGEKFGFRAMATDSILGPAATRISNFNVTAVPEPETYALMLAGLGMVGFMARRRKTNA